MVDKIDDNLIEKKPKAAKEDLSGTEEKFPVKTVTSTYHKW